MGGPRAELWAREEQIAAERRALHGNPRKLLDSSKLFNFGWKPKIELTQGIEQTYNWFIKNIN